MPERKEKMNMKERTKWNKNPMTRKGRDSTKKLARQKSSQAVQGK